MMLTSGLLASPLTLWSWPLLTMFKRAAAIATGHLTRVLEQQQETSHSQCSALQGECAGCLTFYRASQDTPACDATDEMIWRLPLYAQLAALPQEEPWGGGLLSCPTLWQHWGIEGAILLIHEGRGLCGYCPIAVASKAPWHL